MDLETVERILNIIALSMGILSGVVGFLYAIWRWSDLDANKVSEWLAFAVSLIIVLASIGGVIWAINVKVLDITIIAKTLALNLLIGIVTTWVSEMIISKINKR